MSYLKREDGIAAGGGAKGTDPEKKNIQPPSSSSKSHVHHGNVMEIYNGFSARKRSDPE